MNAEELRVGNLIKWISSGDIEAVKDIDTTIKNRQFVNYVNISDAVGIELTEEWLLIFGFTKEKQKRISSEHGSFFSMGIVDCKYSFAYAKFRDDWGFYHSYTDACDDKDNNRFDFISCGIKSVHQLQNLYFALTGEELIPNLQ